MKALNLILVGAAAVAASGFVESSDWYKKAIAEAAAKDPKAGVPLMQKAAKYGAGGAVVFVAAKIGVLGKKSDKAAE